MNLNTSYYKNLFKNLHNKFVKTHFHKKLIITLLTLQLKALKRSLINIQKFLIRLEFTFDYCKFSLNTEVYLGLCQNLPNGFICFHKKALSLILYRILDTPLGYALSMLTARYLYLILTYLHLKYSLNSISQQKEISKPL